MRRVQCANKFGIVLGFSYLYFDILKAHRLFFYNQNLDTFDVKKNLSTMLALFLGVGISSIFFAGSLRP